jgi:hypothetical protein
MIHIKKAKVFVQSTITDDNNQTIDKVSDALRLNIAFFFLKDYFELIERIIEQEL